MGFSVFVDLCKKKYIHFSETSLRQGLSHLPAVDDNVDTGVENEQKVGENCQHVTPAILSC